MEIYNSLCNILGHSLTVTAICISLLSALIFIHYMIEKTAMLRMFCSLSYVILAFLSYCQLKDENLWFTQDAGVLEKYLYIILFLFYVRFFINATCNIICQWQDEVDTNFYCIITAFLFVAFIIIIAVGVLISLFCPKYENLLDYLAYFFIALAGLTYLNLYFEHPGKILFHLGFLVIPFFSIRFLINFFNIVFNIDYFFYIIFALPISLFSPEAWKYHREMEAFRQMKKRGFSRSRTSGSSNPKVRTCTDYCCWWRNDNDHSCSYCDYGGSKERVYHGRKCHYDLTE